MDIKKAINIRKVIIENYYCFISRSAFRDIFIFYLFFFFNFIY